MQGRSAYTEAELRNGEEAVELSLRAWEAAGRPEVVERVWFTQALLALDRRYVHRLRKVTGRECTAVNEVELLVGSILDHDGVLHVGTVLHYDPAQTVLGLRPGERVTLGAADFERLATAFLAELRARFGQ